MSMDGWSVVMYDMIKGFRFIVIVYYILAIFIGGFFSLNMIIAVIKTFYQVEVQS